MPMYATLGNHDWGYADSPAAEVMYTYHSSTWKMPSTYYTFTAGPVQFFALDTNEISRAQLAWLDTEIGKSTARWKVVYGHHPIYSVGAHEDNPRLIQQLLPVLRNRVDVYLAGHDHDMQHLKSEAGVHFFVAGGAGAGLRPPKPDARTIFARDIHGFSVLDVNPDNLQVRFIDTSLKELYLYSIAK
jgi:tartrate-resistant acid phosphatase type 5